MQSTPIVTALIEASQSKSAQTGYAVVSLHFEKIPQITEIDKAEEKALNIFAGAARMYSTLKADFPTSRPPLKVLKSMSRVALGMPSLFPAQRENIYNEIFSVFSPKEPIKGLNGILADWVSSQFLLPGYSTASVEECFQKLKAWGRLDSARIQRALTKATLASTKTFDRTAFKNATALIHRLKTMGVPVKPQTYHTLFQAALELNLTSSAQWAAAELYEMGAELPLPLYREWITKALAEETPHQTLVATKHGWTLSAPLFSHTPSRLSWKALSALTFAAARTQNVKLLESLKEEWVLRSKSASKKWKRVSERMTIHVADTK